MTQPIGPYRLSPAPDPHDESTSPARAAGTIGDLAQRALSYARADALFESLGLGGPPDCTFGDNHDYDRCGNDAPVKNPVLYLQQPADANAIDVEDVHQNRAGDCALLATLGALASTPAGRAVIQNAIVENKDANGEVTSYTVTLHKPESHLLGLGPKTFSEVKVTVEPPFVLGHALSRGVKDFYEEDGPHEVWPLVLEQAYAAVRGGYNETSRGDAPFRAMEVLTGKPAAQHGLGLLGYSAERMVADCAAGKLVVLDTKKSVGNAYQLVDGHAYQVVGTQLLNGKLCVQLRNPWGERQPDLVPCSELAKWFTAVDVGSVR